MNNIIFNGAYRPLSEREIDEFEGSLGSRLPASYRQFLLHTNGGHPHKHMVSDPVDCYVQGFYAITASPDTGISLAYEIALMASELPVDLIAIGCTGTNNRLCLSLRDGKIYLWDQKSDYRFRRARLKELDLLAESIDDLLGKLEEDGEAPPVPDEELENIGRWGDVDLLHAYLKRGNDINAVTADGSTIVEVAVYQGHLDFIKECVSHGAELKATGALHAAIFKMNCEIVKYLLDCGADPNEKNRFGKTPLDNAPPGSSGPAVKLLQARGGTCG